VFVLYVLCLAACLLVSGFQLVVHVPFRVQNQRWGAQKVWEIICQNAFILYAFTIFERHWLKHQ